VSSSRARQLRQASTDAEALLWSRIRGRRLAGYKFRRQYPLGNFVVDFIALEPRLVIEIDGGQHATRIDRDTNRTGELERFGFRVVRYWNHDVLTNIDGVLESVLQELRIVR
jgi:very-short-patch-repair endonuclease